MDSIFLADGTQAWPVNISLDFGWAECLYLATPEDAVARAVRRARLWTPSRWARTPLVVIGKARFAAGRRITQLDPIMCVAVFRFSQPLERGGKGAETALVWTRSDVDPLLPDPVKQWLRERDWDRLVEVPKSVGTAYLDWGQPHLDRAP